MIIADEPTTALDVTIQAQIIYEVQKLARETGTAMIWITHDLSVIAGLADDVRVMYAGRIVESGPTADLLDHPMHPYTAGLIASIPSRNQRGKPLHADSRHDALAAAPETGVRIPRPLLRTPTHYARPRRKSHAPRPRARCAAFIR